MNFRHCFNCTTFVCSDRHSSPHKIVLHKFRVFTCNNFFRPRFDFHFNYMQHNVSEFTTDAQQHLNVQMWLLQINLAKQILIQLHLMSFESFQGKLHKGKPNTIWHRTVTADLNKLIWSGQRLKRSPGTTKSEYMSQAG